MLLYTSLACFTEKPDVEHYIKYKPNSIVIKVYKMKNMFTPPPPILSLISFFF